MEHPVSSLGGTARTTGRRLPELASVNEGDLHAILDAALVAHICVIDQGQPFIVPVGFARANDVVYLHGSTKSRLFTLLASGAPTCLTVTLLDGLVLARSLFESSMHYRSVMVLGSCRVVRGSEKLTALKAISDHLLPGRWGDARLPNAQEDKATMVLALPLDECSVKISSGPPEDSAADLAREVWAGVVPLTENFGEPIASDDLAFDIDVPDYVQRWKR